MKKTFWISSLILLSFTAVSALFGGFVLIKYKYYQLLVVFQGCTLMIWIVVQMIMLQSFNYYHAIYGGTGILLILTGLLLYSRK